APCRLEARRRAAVVAGVDDQRQLGVRRGTGATGVRRDVRAAADAGEKPPRVDGLRLAVVAERALVAAHAAACAAGEDEAEKGGPRHGRRIVASSLVWLHG